MNITILNNTLWNFNDSFGIAFWIGKLPIRWYAILSILGYALAILSFCLVITYKHKINFEPAFYFIFPCLPMCFIGARFWSACIGDLNWENFFHFRSGGLAIQGGVVFGLITGIIYFPLVLRLPKYHVRIEQNGKTYIKQPSFFIYADAIIPTILLGQAIGRWGNFFNGEIFGKPLGMASSTNSLDWLHKLMPGVYENMISRQQIDSSPIGTIFQPLFLYESFLGIFSFIIIYFILANINNIKSGVCAGSYFVAYGIIRFIMEPLRYSNFRFNSTFVMNGILLTFGILWIIYCQWIAPIFRDYYVFKNIKFLFKFYFNRKKKIDLNQIDKYKEKISKINSKILIISSKNVDTYEEKIEKQQKIKILKQKINDINEMIRVSESNNNNNSLKQYFLENKITYVRKESEKIFFANR